MIFHKLGYIFNYFVLYKYDKILKYLIKIYYIKFSKFYNKYNF